MPANISTFGYVPTISLAQNHLDLPYEQRWEHLKPTIVKAYLEDQATLARLAQKMADEFSFKAQTHQYRYHFKKWGIKKRTTTAEKEEVIKALRRRRRQYGFGTSNIQLRQGDWLKPIDKKQLKRHINDSIRKERPLSFRPGMLFSQNLPYSALILKLGGQAQENPSPLIYDPPSPAYLEISSPQNQHSDTDFQREMSPTTQLLNEKVLVDRAQLLLDGQELEMMRQMNNEERIITANWLHDLWMFSFVTTKYWGKGPKDWTFPLIKAKTMAGVTDSSHPNQLSESRELGLTTFSSMATLAIGSPTQLCKWSIHYEDHIKHGATHPPPSNTTEHNGRQNIEDESSWQEWNHQDVRDLTSTITQGFQANAFTTYQAEDLPLAVDRVVTTVSGSIKDARVEAIRLAIMARNVDVLSELLENGDVNWEALHNISPFHLAAKFLDGSTACCGVMWHLMFYLDAENSFGVGFTDESGLTVLDTLFISILRSHSSVEPQVLGSKFAVPGLTFEGSDVDLCGRWDADSPCVRQLHASGETSIPHAWKHIFCHTSAQAVCHCITAIFMNEWAPNINTVSGLFQRRCRSCGSELKLGPLHALVIVAFHLANSGMPGETLFGMLACLVCLLTLKADPSSSAQISIHAVLGAGETEKCQHRSINAAELASAIPDNIVSAWKPELQLGWEAIKSLLKYRVLRAQVPIVNLTNRSFVSLSIPSNVDPCPHRIHKLERAHRYRRRFVECGDKRLGTIWAAIQVELFTYRRLVGGPWLSPMFDMRNIIEGLRATDDSVLMPRVENRGESAFRSFSQCGLFLEGEDTRSAKSEETCASYFAVLDDWERTQFVSNRIDFRRWLR